MSAPVRHTNSPRVRRLAAQAGLNLETIRGTGPSGRVSTEDIRRAVARPAGPARPTVALATSAQLTTVIEVDVTPIVQLGPPEDLSQPAGPEGHWLTLTAFIAEATVAALQQHSVLNASIGEAGQPVVYHAAVHLAVGVDTPRGPLAPVVRDADRLNVMGLARRIDVLAEGARAATLAPDELTGATFTLTNSGRHGALFETPMLTPGQVGVLDVGAVVERPVVKRLPDGARVIAIRSMAHLALSYDHRLVAGADAAALLTTIRRRLETDPAGQVRA